MAVADQATHTLETITVECGLHGLAAQVDCCNDHCGHCDLARCDPDEQISLLEHGVTQLQAVKGYVERAHLARCEINGAYGSVAFLRDIQRSFVNREAARPEEACLRPRTVLEASACAPS